MDGMRRMPLSHGGGWGGCWSGRGDLNPRPPEPHSGTLPGCATARTARDRITRERSNGLRGGLFRAAREVRGPEDQVAGHLDVFAGGDDRDLLDRVSFRGQVVAHRLQLAVPGALDDGDVVQVVDFA